MTGTGPTAAFFDQLYASQRRYWWKEATRYDRDADAYRHSLLTQMTLRLIDGEPRQRVLDLGAGEGADSIRLALLGHEVTAVEFSRVGAKKIAAFAAEANVAIRVDTADIQQYEPTGRYDLVICNGVLHYIADKAAVIGRMQSATTTGGLNVISLWSTYSAVPECHSSVPVFCDDEDGIVADQYRSWTKELHYYERTKPEGAHDDMEPHSHSHIKLIARKP